MKKIIAFIFLLFQASLLFAAQNQLLIVTDIHFNPLASCKHTKTCQLLKTLERLPASQWAKPLKAASSNQYPSIGSDSNNYLLISTINELKKLKQSGKLHPKMILLLGDFYAHDLHKLYRKFSTCRVGGCEHSPTSPAISTVDEPGSIHPTFFGKTLSYQFDLFKKTFPKTPIYIVIGNNDSYQGDYITKINGRLFAHIANLEKQLCRVGGCEHSPTSLQSKPSGEPGSTRPTYFSGTLKKAGYYAIINKHHRLIFLNTNLFSAKDPNKQQDQKAAIDQLRWLKHQLIGARKKHQKVWIAMHIPPMIDVFSSLENNKSDMVPLWQDQFASRFFQLIKHYHSVIKAILAGHLHTDTFELIQARGKPIASIINTPSISPIFGNNAGFKIFTYKDFQLNNFVTYALNIQEKPHPKWREEYNFKKTYGYPLTNEGLYQITTSSSFDHGQYSKLFQRYYAVGSRINQLITAGDWLPYYHCSIQHLNTGSYVACVNFQGQDRQYRFLDRLKQYVIVTGWLPYYYCGLNNPLRTPAYIKCVNALK